MLPFVVSPSMRTSRHLLHALLVLVVLASTVTAEEVFPKDLVDFVPAAVNPVFEGRGPGYWDARHRERGWILREGDAWHMWFTGYDNTREGQKKLGYASSTDGLIWKRAEQPLYDEHWVEDMMVVKQGETYYMFAEGLNDQAQLLTSPDRLHWTRVGTFDIRLKDGSPIKPGPFGTPVGWYENETWHLFYERGDRGVWLATSQDMKVWTNEQDEPVMLPGPAEHEKDMIAFNQIIQRGKQYFVYYHGAATLPKPSIWSTNIAVSDDLLHWTKFAGNPLTLDNTSSGIVVEAGSAEHPELRLYTMHDKVRVHYPSDHRETTRQLPDGRIIIDSASLATPFNFTRPGHYTVSAVHSGTTAAEFALQLEDDSETALQGIFALTGSDRRFSTQLLGSVRVLKPGPQQFHLKSPSNNSAEVHQIRALILTPSAEGKPIQQAEDGVVTCPARDVTIHGVKVQYEPKPEKNTVGYWVNADDWISWDFSLAKAGEYQVEVLQGCGKGEGGSDVDVTVAGQTVKFTVEDTGHFQNFKPRVIGTVTLAKPGDYGVIVKPTRKAKNAVMDIRQLRLIPKP